MVPHRSLHWVRESLIAAEQAILTHIVGLDDHRGILRDNVSLRHVAIGSMDVSSINCRIGVAKVTRCMKQSKVLDMLDGCVPDAYGEVTV